MPAPSSLAGLAVDNGVAVPSSIQAARWLTPWAAQLRYEMLEPLDREAAMSVVTDAVAWARTLIEEAEAKQKPPEGAGSRTAAGGGGHARAMRGSETL